LATTEAAGAFGEDDEEEGAARIEEADEEEGAARDEEAGMVMVL
jgi:hypothetical protein